MSSNVQQDDLTVASSNYNNVNVDVNEVIENELFQVLLQRSHSSQYRIQKVDAIVLAPFTTPTTPVTNSTPAPEPQNVFETTLIADKFLILDQIEGSSLYRCINVNSQREYVCKIIQRGETVSNLIWAHYQMADCRHVNKLIEVLMNNRHLYIIFERAYGDLHSYVREKKQLAENEAKSFFKQIAKTVKACHQHNIVLRDLKLRKFVFANTQRTELKLESLEGSVIVEDGAEGDLLQDKRGCPSYVSPEILKVGGNYSGKSADMWSLGVILYTMLVGRYPFNDSEHVSLFMKITRGFFVIPDGVSFQAKSLIRSLLRREPLERLASEDLLYHPWLKHGDYDYTMSAAYSKYYDQIVPGSENSDDDEDDDDDDDDDDEY